LPRPRGMGCTSVGCGYCCCCCCCCCCCIRRRPLSPFSNREATTHLAGFSAGSGQHDSLIKLLLGVEAVQPFLIDRLLEKLPQFVDDGYLKAFYSLSRC
jgi:hypothetical protein